MADLVNQRFIFEPHALYGQKINGETHPLGYISLAPGQPVFGLDVPLLRRKEDLLALAKMMTAAPALYDACKSALFVLRIVYSREPGTNEAGAIRMLEKAISLANPNEPIVNVNNAEG